VFAAVVGVGLGFNWIIGDAPSAAIEGPGAAVAVAAAVFLLLRRPWMPLFAVVACAAVTAIGGAQSANPGWFAILLVVVWCTLVAGRRVGVPLWIAAMALFTVEWSVIRHDGGWGAWLAGTTCVFLVGLLLRNQFGLVARLRTAQAGLAAKARAEERNRIARDVHDVIAHSLTVSLLHVMSARLAVESDPADAARALAEAERLGRESLSEVRQVVGLLRTGTGPGTGTGVGTGPGTGVGTGTVGGSPALPRPAPPQPGVTGIPELVGRFQAAGADFSLTVDGDTGRLPATVGLAVYRILQEALTNAIRHAPGQSAAARLVVHPQEVTLTVDSAGEHGAGEPGLVTGHGIIGMRERAQAAGGRCSAGPGGSGWLVRATFPLPPAADPAVPGPVPRSGPAS
jgi:signal transduction histidine kinase